MYLIVTDLPDEVRAAWRFAVDARIAFHHSHSMPAGPARDDARRLALREIRDANVILRAFNEELPRRAFEAANAPNPHCPFGTRHAEGAPCDERCDDKAELVASLRELLAGQMGGSR